MKQKYCPYCQTWKPISEFQKDKHNKDNLANRCKKCRLKQTKAWRVKNPLKYKLIGIKGSAKKRNHKWELSNEYAYKLIQSPCYYCGQKGINGIDRINSSKGYIIGNVVSCCKYCNYAKNDLMIKEFLEHAKKITNYNKRKNKL